LVPPARILIVDDEPFKRDVLIQELEILDHEGLTAIHGRDALDQLSCDTVDLILLDIMMPEMEASGCCAASRTAPGCAISR
jgi:CheY-like chemotaxis protein